MEIDPISAYAARSARNAMERLREYADLAEQRILFHANYLRDLAEGIRQMEIEQAKNAEFFDKYRRGP